MRTVGLNPTEGSKFKLNILFMSIFLKFFSAIVFIAYLFFLYKIRFLKENTVINNIILDSIGALLMICVLIASIVKSVTWLTVLSSIILIFDIANVIYYIISNKTLR